MKAIGYAIATGLAIGFTIRKLLGMPKRDAASSTLTMRRMRVDVFEKDTGLLVIGIVAVAEETDGRGHYRFIRPDATYIDLDLTDADYRIVRQRISV